MDSYEFSLASRRDTDEVLHVYRSLISSPGCAWNLEYPDKETAEADIDNNSLYVLRKEDRIVAVASIEKPEDIDHLGWTPKNPCELSRVGVVPALQNQGVATVILQNMIEVIRNRGFDGIVMLVSKTNPAALALYDKNGFEKCGETSLWGVDFYCYQMVFTPAS